MPGGGTKTVTTTNRPSLVLRYRRRLIRKKLLWRAFRKRRELTALFNAQPSLSPDAILCFTTLRNEALRLPYFLEHYRTLGVTHFFFVDNGSEDGSADILKDALDTTVFETGASYRASRFGVDWLNWLKLRYAHNHWVVVADVDELLIYPRWKTQNLPALTRALEAQGHNKMGAIMLDLYPKGRLEEQSYAPGQNPIDVLAWYDAYGYWAQRQRKLGNLWLQGGVRARYFFPNDPDRAPTLNKIPLVKWNRAYAFVNSCHSALPSRLNETWTVPISGALLHTKFLPGTADRASIEKARDEHFHVGTRYGDYYSALQTNPDFWNETSSRFEGSEKLVEQGLMRDFDW